MSFAFLPTPRAAVHNSEWSTAEGHGDVTVIGYDCDEHEWMVLDAERRATWISSRDLVFAAGPDDPIGGDA